jgi:predicted nucleotidyltransferase
MVRTAKKPSLINIDHKIKELCRYFSGNLLITAAFIYGSYGTEHQTHLSDVDLALLIRNDKVPLSLEEELKISAEISSLAGEDDINAIILNGAPLPLQYKVLATGRLIYEKEASGLSDFIEFVTKRYIDFAIDLKQFYREYDQSLKEAYLVDRQR